MEIKSDTPVETREAKETNAPLVGVEEYAKRRRSRKRSITIFVVVSILNVALLVLLWTQLLTPARNQATAGTSFSSSSGLGDISSPLVGTPMPDFTLKTLDGNTTVHLASFKGKAIILNFWASWCTGCVQEAPFLQKIQPQLQTQGVAFIGIDGQESASNALAFLQKNNMHYLNVQDTLNGDTTISYGVTGFPETVFINRNGIIVAKWAGPLSDSGLRAEMAKMKL